MLIVWIIVFVVSLAVLVKGADWLIASSEKIGLSLGLSHFIIGVTIVAVGTSLPELVSSLAATLKGLTDVPVANAVGSNIANILLIVGFAALFGKKLVVTKNLIDIDLPLLAIGTVLLLGVVWDRQVTFGEALLLVVTYGVYSLYSILHKDVDEHDPTKPKKEEVISEKKKSARPKLKAKDFILLIVGTICLVFGAKYLVESLVNLSSILNIATGVIAITAVAIGTSLPELIVSIRAALQKKSEIALGNIFGSNIFNAFMVVGIPGLFKGLEVDNQTFLVGVPTMALATLLFVISGISKRIHMWEGLFFIAIYILFIAKIFGWF